MSIYAHSHTRPQTQRPTLYPWGIRLTRHVVERYMERRGWTPSKDGVHDTKYLDADWCIRKLLERCADQHPPLLVKGGEARRHFRHGKLHWITDGDVSVVITFYGH